VKPYRSETSKSGFINPKILKLRRSIDRKRSEEIGVEGLGALEDGREKGNDKGGREWRRQRPRLARRSTERVTAVKDASGSISLSLSTTM
jgi:hypothetical protein